MKNLVCSNSAINVLGFPSGLAQKDVSFFNFATCSDNAAVISYDHILKEKTAGSPLFIDMYLDIQSFMTDLFKYSLYEKASRYNALLSGIEELNSMFLGMSNGSPRGNSVGNELKNSIKKELRFLVQAALQGNFTPNVLTYGVNNIGPDRVSDILSCIIKRRLLKYTEEIVNEYGIASKEFEITVYNSETGLWEITKANLPVYQGNEIILTPKVIISDLNTPKNLFRGFISSVFRDYIKGSGSELDKDSTLKGFYESLSENDISIKNLLKDYIINNPSLVQDFENDNIFYLNSLSDSQLENITHVASLKCG